MIKLCSQLCWQKPFLQRMCIPGRIVHEMCFNLKLSGNQVCRTMFSILLLKIMLCSQLHCQQVCKLKHISYQIVNNESAELMRMLNAVKPAPTEADDRWFALHPGFYALQS